MLSQIWIRQGLPLSLQHKTWCVIVTCLYSMHFMNDKTLEDPLQVIKVLLLVHKTISRWSNLCRSHKFCSCFLKLDSSGLTWYPLSSTSCGNSLLTPHKFLLILSSNGNSWTQRVNLYFADLIRFGQASKIRNRQDIINISFDPIFHLK